MASTVTKIYDYTSMAIPPELRSWRVTEAEVEESLALLAKDHAALQNVEQAQDGDSLRCVLPDGRTVLLYPGRGLPGAEDAEKAAIGKRAGEAFPTRVGQTDVTLEVKEILRLVDHPVDDALVHLENIPGVDSLAAYRDWYIRENNPKKREKAAATLAREFFEKMREESEFSIDEDEKAEWCRKRGKYIYDMMVENGHDPHIPDEGTELLSDEEALAQFVKGQEPMYRDFVLFRHLSQQDGYVYTHDMFVADMKKRFEDNRERWEAMGAQLEESLSDISFLMGTETAYMEHVFGMLKAAAEKYLED